MTGPVRARPGPVLSVFGTVAELWDNSLNSQAPPGAVDTVTTMALSFSPFSFEGPWSVDVATTITAFLLGMLPIAYASFLLARRWATRTEAAGVAIHSRPGQYGWYGVMWVALPALVVALIAAFIQLFGLGTIPGPLLVAAALTVGAGGIWFARATLRPGLRARNILDRVIRWVLLAAALVSILTTFGIVISILFESIRFFEMVSFWHFITGTEWAPDTGFMGDAADADPKFGSVPLFAGTFMITAVAMLVAVPVGLLSAIYMSEYATRAVRGMAKPTLEVLAGIPTVVYGFFAAIVVAPAVVDAAGFVGLDASYQSALASGLVMGVMIIPFISSLSDDVINSVPQSLREGAYALGTTQSETIKQVILPAALPGIISATLLAISRALGETMIVVMAAGLRPNLTWNPLEDMTTVTVRIVDALTGDQAFDSPETLSAFALGLVLFVITLCLNLVSTVMVRRFRQKYE